MISLFDSPARSARDADVKACDNVFRFLWRSSSRHQMPLVLLSLLVAALSMLPLELQRRVVDDVLSAPQGAEQAVRELGWLGAAYLAVIVLHGLAKLALRLYRGWVSESAQRYTRERLSGVQECRLASAGSSATGRGVSVIGSEVEQVCGFVGDGVSEPVVQGGMLLFMLGYMFYIEPVVAAFSLLFLLPQAILVPWLQGWINRLLERRTHLLRDLADDLGDAERNDLQAEAGDCSDVSESVVGWLDSIYSNRMRVFAVKYGTKALTNLLNALAPLSVLVVGGYFVLQGETTLGVVVAFTSGFQKIADPLRDLLAYYRMAAQAAVKYRLIGEWL